MHMPPAPQAGERFSAVMSKATTHSLTHPSTHPPTHSSTHPLQPSLPPSLPQAGEPYSVVVNKAKELGYTEPDPRDDLGGVDVARKALILARTLGMSLEMSDVSGEHAHVHVHVHVHVHEHGGASCLRNRAALHPLASPFDPLTLTLDPYPHP